LQKFGADFRRKSAIIQKRAAKLADAELHASRSRMHQVMTLMPAAVYTCDTAGRITFFNERAADLWGREPQTLETDREFSGSLCLRRLDGESSESLGGSADPEGGAHSGKRGFNRN
jgi:PAS domain-containing protein